MMKGDFSRIRFTPGKHFTSVLEQQGRVSLDADANEQCAINEHLRSTQVIDTIGRVGGPAGHAGFGITVEDSAIHISGGRYYVHGLLCEGSATDYMDQPYLINPGVADSDYLQDLEAGTIDAICVQLEVWQRLVSALDDFCLLEPALGQADTTARLQTVWRVVASPNLPANTNGAGSARTDKLERPGRLCVDLSEAGDDCSCQPIPPAGYQGLENQLYRIEIHQAGDETSATYKWSRENASVVAAVISYSGTNPRTIFVDSLGKDANLGFAANQWVEISDDTNEFGSTPNQPGQLCQISSVSPSGQPPSITFTTTVPAVDPTRNARVRRWDQLGTGTAGDMPLSVTTPVDIENGIQVTFTPGTYKSGDYWLIPARTASGTIDWPPCGSNGAACQPANAIRVFTTPLALITARDDVLRTHAETINEVSSSKADPVIVGKDPTFRIIDNEDDFLVQDLRSFFTPLSSNALHIARISWANDDVITLDQLAASGLKLLFDDAPTSLIDGSVFRVSVEIPDYREADSQRVLGDAEFSRSNRSSGQAVLTGQITNAPKLRDEFVIDGVITVVNNIVSWQLLTGDPTNKVENLLGRLVFLELNQLLQAVIFAPDPTWFARVRVRLLGHMIYTQTSASQAGCGPARTLFLDGQCFGQTGTRRDNTPRIDLHHPSGNGAMASDFESWFYLAPATAISGLSFNPPIVTLPDVGASGTTTGTVTVSTPVSADTIVSLSFTPPSGLTVSMPATITIPSGLSSQAFTADFTDTVATTATGVACNVTASFASAIEALSSAAGTFTVIAQVIIQ